MTLIQKTGREQNPVSPAVLSSQPSDFFLYATGPCQVGPLFSFIVPQCLVKAALLFSFYVPQGLVKLALCFLLEGGGYCF